MNNIQAVINIIGGSKASLDTPCSVYEHDYLLRRDSALNTIFSRRDWECVIAPTDNGCFCDTTNGLVYEIHSKPLAKRVFAVTKQNTDELTSLAWELTRLPQQFGWSRIVSAEDTIWVNLKGFGGHCYERTSWHFQLNQAEELAKKIVRIAKCRGFKTTAIEYEEVVLDRWFRQPSYTLKITK